MPQPANTEAPGVAREIALLILSLVRLISAMAAYWFYPFPNGNRPDLWGFIALFFREALLLALFGVFGLVLLLVAILGALRNLFRKARANSTRLG